MCINNSDGCEEDGARLFSVLFSDRTRYNGHKMKYREYLNIKPHIFSSENGQTLEVFQRGGSLVVLIT